MFLMYLVVILVIYKFVWLIDKVINYYYNEITNSHYIHNDVTSPKLRRMSASTLYLTIKWMSQG